MTDNVKCGECVSAVRGIAKENEGLVWCDDSESENYQDWFDPVDERPCDDFTRKLS